MFSFQLSLLLFKPRPCSHHSYTCRRAEQSHTWQLVSSGRLGASLEHLPWRSPTHPPTPRVPALRDGSCWGSGLLSCLHAKLFLQCLQPRAKHWCQGFHPFQFLGAPHPFSSGNIPLILARLLSRGKRFRWLCSLCLCQRLTFLLTRVSQQGAGAGGHGLCTLAMVTGHWALSS